MRLDVFSDFLMILYKTIVQKKINTYGCMKNKKMRKVMGTWTVIGLVNQENIFCL